MSLSNRLKHSSCGESSELCLHPCKMYAVKRLARDLRSLVSDPVPGVVARQDEHDALTVHVNMLPMEGAYAGVPVHMHLIFPPAYPSAPPRVDLKTPLVHPNVFSWGICLDMLRDGEYSMRPYQGWSAAYDLAGVLRQLYSFLLGDDNIDQDYGEAVSRTDWIVQQRDLDVAAAFRCPCGYAQLPETVASPPTAAPEPAAAGPLPELPTDIMRTVLSMAGGGTLTKCVETEDADDLTAMASEEKRRLEHRCFFTKAAPEADTVLGLGVQVEFHRDGKVRCINTTMDLLSHRAYKEHNVRRSAWNFPVNRFLPLPLDPLHAERALPLLKPCLARMLAPTDVPDAPQAACSRDMSGDGLIAIMAQLINSTVVGLVKDGPQQHTVAAHMSDAALQVFCHLHHLLLSAVAGLPNDEGAHLSRACIRDVQAFVSSPDARSKARCPDLGVLLVKLLLVPADTVPWGTFAPPFMRELLARQVLWLQRERGERFVRPWDLPAGPQADADRMAGTFQTCTTGLRVVALQAWFANALGRPSQAGRAAAEKLLQIKHSYDARSGAPPPGVFRRFNEHARHVMQLTKWTEVLAALRLGLRQDPLGPAALWASVLRQATVDSYRAGYHKLHEQARKPPAGFNYALWEPAAPVAVVSDAWGEGAPKPT